jgi:hypothetical protein
MKRARSDIDRLLSDLRRDLRPLGRRARRRALDEVRDHLLSAVADEAASGPSVQEREQRAVRLFGDAETVARLLRDARPKHRRTVAPALVGAIAAIGFLALPAGPVSEELAPRDAAAASIPAQPNAVAARPCAASWNSSANALWHSYAKRLGSRRAYVGVAYSGTASKSGKLTTTRRACVVKLWLAHRPGHWQYAVNVAGPLLKGGVSYGTRAFPASAKTPLHVHQRTTIQFANSRVRADGTLDYIGTSIPSQAD